MRGAPYVNNSLRLKKGRRPVDGAPGIMGMGRPDFAGSESIAQVAPAHPPVDADRRFAGAELIRAQARRRLDLSRSRGPAETGQQDGHRRREQKPFHCVHLALWQRG